MKKFLVTSSVFSGEIVVLYQEKQGFFQLVMIDFLQAEITDEQANFFKNTLPAKVTDWNEILEAFGSNKLVFTSSNFQVSFDTFWNKYDRKINRLRCEKIWDKMSLAAKAEAYVFLPKYTNHLQLNAWKNKADPETYLRDRFWENDYKK